MIDRRHFLSASLISGLMVPLGGLAKPSVISTPRVGLIRNDLEPDWNRRVSFGSLPMGCNELLRIVHDLEHFYNDPKVGRDIAKKFFPLYKSQVRAKLDEFDKLARIKIDAKLSDELNKQQLWNFFDSGIGLLMLLAVLPPLASYGAILTSVGLISMAGKYAYQAFVAGDQVTDRLDFWLTANDGKWFTMSRVHVDGKRVFDAGVTKTAPWFTLLSLLFTASYIYQTSNKKDRLEQLFKSKKHATEVVATAHKALSESLTSEDAFLEHMRAGTPQAFEAVSSIWQTLAIGNCVIHKDLSLKEMVRESTRPIIHNQLY